MSKGVNVSLLFRCHTATGQLVVESVENESMNVNMYVCIYM